MIILSMAEEISMQWWTIMLYLAVPLWLVIRSTFLSCPLCSPGASFLMAHSHIAPSISPPIFLKCSIFRIYLSFYSLNPSSCLFGVADFHKGWKVGSFQFSRAHASMASGLPIVKIRCLLSQINL